jgi:hypothetical protein
MPTNLKSHYAPTLVLLESISCSCGLIAWFAQFLIPCAESRLHALLTLGSLLFLANVLAILLTILILYPLADADAVTGWRKRLVRWQVVITSLITGAGFIVLVLAVLFMYHGDKILPGIGIAMFVVLVVAACVLGAGTKGPGEAVDEDNSQKHPPTPAPFLVSKKPAREVPELGAKHIVTLTVVCVVEILGMIALLIVGGIEAAEGKLPPGCRTLDDWTTANPLPVRFVVHEEQGTATSWTVVTVTVTEEASGLKYLMETLSATASNHNIQPSTVVTCITTSMFDGTLPQLSMRDVTEPADMGKESISRN